HTKAGANPSCGKRKLAAPGCDEKYGAEGQGDSEIHHQEKCCAVHRDAALTLLPFRGFYQCWILRKCEGFPDFRRQPA
ncbi:MAG: hypothetical protein ACK4HD_16035, partial [Pannonibacter phragmitetus]